MISTIYSGTIGDVTDKFGEKIKKPNPVIQYSFMKGAYRADRYLSYCTTLKKTSNGAKYCALSNQLCIIQFFSSAQVTELRIKTEAQMIST
jgi:hypothetical protein